MGGDKENSSKAENQSIQQERGSDLFIVDNSDEQWRQPLPSCDWCDIASAMDIATGYFEIGGLTSFGWAMAEVGSNQNTNGG